jgi:long-chain fatty acid transport protein
MYPESLPTARHLTSFALAATVCSAGATGFRLPDQDAFATGRGEAFAATADNPSAIYYNPAGITQLEGHQVRGGLYGIYFDTNYESPSGHKSRNQADLHGVPQLFYTYTPESFPLAFGLGTYLPFGLSSSWPDDSGFRTLGLKARLTYGTVNPVVAWRITPTLSIAAGATLNWADTDLRQGFLTAQPGFGDVFKFTGDGFDAGFNLGLMWKPCSKIQFGVAYRSETTIDLEGTSTLKSPLPQFNGAVPASAEFPFPQNLIAGISYRPTEAWNFEFDVDWTGWDRMNTVPIVQAPFPTQTLVLDWESSFYYEFGVTRRFKNGWSISGGYIYNENSIPDVTFTPLVSDLNRHFFSIGTGHHGKHFDFDVAYQFGYGPTRTVAGSPTWTSPQNPLDTASADGDYEFFSHALSFTAGWRF